MDSNGHDEVFVWPNCLSAVILQLSTSLTLVSNGGESPSYKSNWSPLVSMAVY